MDLLRRKLIVRSRLATYPRKILTKEAYLSLCATHDRVKGLSSVEAEQFLHSLCSAGTIAPLGKDLYHLSPVDVINGVHMACGLTPFEANLPSLVEKHEDISSSLKTMSERTSDTVERAAVKEKEFWATMTFLSGLQMTVLAYLTFVVWGWDVMEPVTYFITTITALGSYAYFLLFRRQQTYEQLDNILLPRYITQDLIASDLDVKRWLKEVEMHGELAAVLQEDVLLGNPPSFPTKQTQK